MFSLDSKGYWEPTKMFPCDCGGEGLTMTLFVDDSSDFGDEDYFDLALWQQAMKWKKQDSMPWKARLRCAWDSLRGQPWRSQVSMTVDTARNLANYILYQIAKRKDTKKPESVDASKAFFQKANANVQS